MKTIIIGLGNPGKKFENTRHNVGFMAVDKFAEKNNFPDFKLSRLQSNRGSSTKSGQKKSDALVSENGDIILAKPQTFMNNSGLAVKSLIKNLKLKIKNYIIVVHDDIDLPVGKIKIVKDRGSAGHKGVESIIKAVGNENLIRLRIGIRPASAMASAGKAKKIVLKNFSKEEQKIINEVIFKTAEAIDSLLKNGLEKTINEYNK